MPRGKRTVFAMFCSECNERIGTVRLHKQNSKGVSWKDLKLEKYCPVCKKRVPVKMKEEKHSS
jgi:ribosomal protein L33